MVTVLLVIVIFVLEKVTRVRNRSGVWRRGRGRLRDQGIRGGSREGGGRVSSRAAVRRAVVLEGLTLFQGLATVIEELGVLLVLTTDRKATGAVVLIVLAKVRG